ncbi:MAG: hypothetical protein ACREQE_00190 [Candidatus Binataceae bacterium]
MANCYSAKTRKLKPIHRDVGKPDRGDITFACDAQTAMLVILPFARRKYELAVKHAANQFPVDRKGECLLVVLRIAFRPAFAGGDSSGVVRGTELKR